MSSDLLRDQTLIRMALTVRLGWVLHRLRIRARPELLEELRAHVLLSLPEPVSLTEMERLSEFYLQDYLERVRHGRYRPISSEPAEDLPVSRAWRLSVEAACDPQALSVLRLRYGDGLPPAQVASLTGLDISEVHAAIEGLREITRLEAVAHGVDESLLHGSLLDRILCRVAVASGDDCPGASSLVQCARGPRAPDRHMSACPRCARAIRLLRAGVLDEADFLAPPEIPEHPPKIGLLSLHLHPQARRQRAALLTALGPAARAAGDDSILLDVSRAPDWESTIQRRVLLGQPRRDHLRGALVETVGQWGARCVLGPAPVLAIETSRARPWGEIDGISALPESIHPPISAARLWSSAGLAAVLALAVGTLVLWNREERAEYPLEADPTWEAGSLTVRFDVDDLAYVDIYAISTAGLRAEVVSRSPADKAALATGEGDFLLGVSGSALVLVSNDEPMGDLRDAIVGSVDSREGRQEIRKRIRARHPKADVLVLPAYPPS